MKVHDVVTPANEDILNIIKTILSPVAKYTLQFGNISLCTLYIIACREKLLLILEINIIR